MAKRNGKTCVLFDETPPGTQYRAGNYGWVQNSTADEYIDDEYAVEYNPMEEKEEQESKDPVSDIPEDFPARHHFIEADISSLDAVKKLADDGELQSVAGIGNSTEHKIENYLGE